MSADKGPRDRRRRPWRAADGDSRCQACGGPNVVWWVDYATWNYVMGSEAGILCPTCFILEANDKGLGRSGAWQIHPAASLF